jgi:hypothetical protein
MSECPAFTDLFEVKVIIMATLLAFVNLQNFNIYCA